ncbi:flagellar hook protein FlgE [Jeongeupia chitinilytica]|uniref:Flagellar hook protein FlgE n=1 Tax=Jeongeupia chitinilytica TaxID=1041641 RepID=A0ABQ3H3V1_9NEIS|nr:flagellar hook-basal body complex protein [Jeongeupia chitinilytica]GHD63412.1 flagellar hook protein FlgE [Jeongeupia chitinilytica]
MSIEIALSGINAINDQLGSISNNIANSGTYGFKSSRANFASTYAGTQPTGVQVGSHTQTIGQIGGVLTTGRSMDAAIQGRGFFATRDSAGATVFTRVGIFNADKQGNVVDSYGRRLQGYPLAPGATTPGPLGDLSVPSGQIAALPSSKMQYVGNISADWTVPTVAPFNAADPQSFNGSMVTAVYDSLGAQHSVTQYFVKTGTNTVDVHYAMDGAPLATTNSLTFNPQGQLTAPTAPVALALGTPAGAAALTVNLDYTGTTQFAGEATTTVNSANGYASGILTGVAIAEDGSIMAQYSNGQKQSVGTIALATFPNEDGLTPVSDTAWTTSNASGNVLYFTPGSGMAGKLAGGSLEQSNVEMTSELVNLMSAQRNYQANTKVISTESEMMKNLMQAV